MDNNIIGAAQDLELGEEKLVRLVRKMDPELGTIAQIVIKKGWPEPKPLERVKPNRLIISDTESMISYVQKWGNPETDIIFYSENEAIYLRDIRAEFLPSGKNEQAVLTFKNSREFARWHEVIKTEKGFDHKSLLKLLRENQDDIPAYAVLMESWSAIETAVSLHRDSSLDDLGGRRIGVEFTSRTGKKNPGTLIDHFQIRIPVLHFDDPTLLSVAIDIEEPDSADKPAFFSFRSRAVLDAKLKAVQGEIELIKTELCDWQILFGWPW